MKLTRSKVIHELKAKHGWDQTNIDQHKWMINPLLKDILTVVDNHLKKHKGLTIK